jgi:hypothetical protein
MKTLGTKRLHDNADLENFVEFYCWAKPFKNILEGKSNKKGGKVNTLLEELGQYGPLVDQVIRGTIPHMLVFTIGDDPNEVTKKQPDGKLFNFLKRYFRDPIIIQTIDKWFDSTINIDDYETAYRHYRQNILVLQYQRLLSRPKTTVSNFKNHFT